MRDLSPDELAELERVLGLAAVRSARSRHGKAGEIPTALGREADDRGSVCDGAPAPGGEGATAIGGVRAPERSRPLADSYPDPNQCSRCGSADVALGCCERTWCAICYLHHTRPTREALRVVERGS